MYKMRLKYHAIDGNGSLNTTYIGSKKRTKRFIWKSGKLQEENEIYMLDEDGLFDRKPKKYATGGTEKTCPWRTEIHTWVKPNGHNWVWKTILGLGRNCFTGQVCTWMCLMWYTTMYMWNRSASKARKERGNDYLEPTTSLPSSFNRPTRS